MKPPHWHKPEHNRHHAWSEKKDFKKKSERDFRSYGGFIIRNTPIPVHNYLHFALDKPEKPYRDEMKGILELCEEAKPHAGDNPYWAMEATMAYYVGREVESPSDAEHCRNIRFNFAQQIGILAHEHTFQDPITREGKLVIPGVVRV